MGWQNPYKLLRILNKYLKNKADTLLFQTNTIDEMGKKVVKTTIMRQLWAIIQETSGKTVAGLNDSDLINQIIGKLNSKQHLSSEDCSIVSTYLRSRIPLIREITQ